MKKYIIPILVLVSLFSCHRHDKLWDSIVGIENRLTVLEQQCKEMNTNISSMRVVVDVVQNNDYVTGVSTVLENGIEVGYKISFNTHPAVIIYHGKSGQDGLSPVIGVKQAEDGKYYWTQKLGTTESTWILDDSGNKVMINGSDGQDGKEGVIPQFKILFKTGIGMTNENFFSIASVISFMLFPFTTPNGYSSDSAFFTIGIKISNGP